MTWPVKKLGDVCDVLDNKRKPITKRDRVVGKYPYYGATGILGYVDGYIFDERLVLIGEDGAKWGEGDVSAFIAEGKYWVNNHAHVLRPIKDVLVDDWLIYFLNYSDLSKYITGLTVQKLNQSKMKEILLPLPPLPEQKRLVAKLDRIFADIERAKGNAERNLKNARELFESYLNGIFEKAGEGWVEKELGEIFDIARGGSPRPIQDYLTNDPSGLNWIKIGDTKNVSKYIENTKQRIIKSGLKKTRLVQPGDFILSNSMSFGKPYIMKIAGCIHDGWLVLKKRDDNIDQDFFYYLLGSSFVYAKFDRCAMGSTVRNLNIGLVQKIKVFYPSISDQKKIVKKLDELSAETKKLEGIYRKELADLEELRKAVLRKAFGGEL